MGYVTRVFKGKWELVGNMADERDLKRTHLMLDQRHLDEADRRDINLSGRVRTLLDEDFDL